MLPIDNKPSDELHGLSDPQATPEGQLCRLDKKLDELLRKSDGAEGLMLRYYFDGYSYREIAATLKKEHGIKCSWGMVFDMVAKLLADFFAGNRVTQCHFKGNTLSRQSDAKAKVDHKADEVSKEPEIHSPTASAEFILHLLLRDDEAESVGGDLQERYSRKVKQFGTRRADIWLWSQVLRSIWPLVKRFLTAGGFLAAVEYIRKLLS